MARLTVEGRADAEAFLARLVRLDPAALVRLRGRTAGGAGEAGSPAYEVALWAQLPWDVLVTRLVAASVPAPADATVSAGALLHGLADDALPAPRDLEWHWRLPPSAGAVVECIPPNEIRRVGVAAAQTLRRAAASGVGGRALGERALRDALLDHVPIVVQAGGDRVEVPQRLVQAVLRMGFLGGGPAGPVEPSVAVLRAGSWVGLAAGYGTAWQQVRSPLAVRARR